MFFKNVPNIAFPKIDMSNLKIVSYSLVLLKCIDTLIYLYETRGLSNLFFQNFEIIPKIFMCLQESIYLDLF